MVGRLAAEVLAELDARLAGTDRELASRYPGDRPGRQPVHTVYVPADRVVPDLVQIWGRAALATLDRVGLADDMRERVAAKLTREPIEDLRVDFEDGLGAPPDEDTVVRQAARALLDSAQLPPFIGLRCKSLEASTRHRAVRTLDLFLAAVDRPVIITLPKVSTVSQVEAMVRLCEALERAYGIARLSFEIQIELPQAILGADGTATVARMIHAAEGRCTGLHYGTYDYSAACGIAAAQQAMDHPAADHAKAVMQAAAAGTGVRLSDGSTNVLPIGDAEAVAWATHARLVRRSLERGFYQGWDLHPAQLPTRYAATYQFFREGAPAAVSRLRAYRERQESHILDEPATVRALESFLRRGLDCGALDESEVQL